MDNVFQEEKKKLAEVEAKLDAIANKHEQHGKDMDRIDSKESSDMERSPGKLLVDQHGD